MNSTRNRSRATALLLPFIVALTGCDIAMLNAREKASADWRKTYELQPGGRVEIVNVNGKIAVLPGQGNTVEVVATKTAKGSSVEAAKQNLERIEIRETSGAGTIRIETLIDRSSGLFHNGGAGVEYQVRLPAGAELKASTVNGGIEITGISGRVRAETTNGGIKAREIGGPIEASTTNGGVDVDLAKVADEGARLECTNGGIVLRLPTDARATIAARITNGGIGTEGLTLRSSGESSRRRLDGDLNGGGPRITLEGTNGGIKISAR